ncbi:hypothetical protein [Blastococcus brunescens]|uniref:Uncharacterized protein n=1 Tax=Blastococcus brunescens TaxID=1564165 RepID=A0ABZ1AT56_9ACTN|nr:hypothetical protein [Blastococcus sp. BMG 8361]WRL61753.1 hypothetical protein U6N30_16625 [Blastococcus sp. BMG 8361]
MIAPGGELEQVVVAVVEAVGQEDARAGHQGGQQRSPARRASSARGRGS